MNSETSLEEILARPCIGDTSLLCNFVYTGYADLLLQLVGEPLFLSPSIPGRSGGYSSRTRATAANFRVSQTYLLSAATRIRSLPRSSSLHSELCRSRRQFVEPRSSFHR